MLGVKVNRPSPQKCKYNTYIHIYVRMCMCILFLSIFSHADGISSRSSNYLDHYSNYTSASAASIKTSNTLDTANAKYSTEDYSTSTEEGDWVWVPKGQRSPGGYYFQSKSYQEAQERQGFLALLNPSTLV